MYTHLIFDLDGTLLNTLEDLAQACNWVCGQHGWPTFPVEAYKQFVGNGARKLLERVAPPGVAAPELVDQTTAEFTRYYTAHGTEKTHPYPGVPQALERLRERGIVLAVLTNKPDQAAAPVVERYYPGVFSVVQGALPHVPTKPDPTVLHRLMDRIGARPQTTLFVGDSNVDIRTAKNGGLTSCGVLWGFRTRAELEAEGADFIAERPQRIVELALGQ